MGYGPQGPQGGRSAGGSAGDAAGTARLMNEKKRKLDGMESSKSKSNAHCMHG